MTFLSLFAQATEAAQQAVDVASQAVDSASQTVDVASQTSGQLPLPALILIFCMPLLCFGLALSLFLLRYKRCPTNKLLVVYTKTEKQEKSITVTNQSRFILPVFQDYSWLSLDPMEKEIFFEDVKLPDGSRTNLVANFSMAVGTTEDLMQNAGRWIAELEESDIMQLVEEMIQHRSEHIIASMPVNEIRRNDILAARIRESVAQDLQRIGLVPLTLNISSST